MGYNEQRCCSTVIAKVNIFALLSFYSNLDVLIFSVANLLNWLRNGRSGPFFGSLFPFAMNMKYIFHKWKENRWVLIKNRLH